MLISAPGDTDLNMWVWTVKVAKCLLANSFILTIYQFNSVLDLNYNNSQAEEIIQTYSLSEGEILSCA